MKRLLATVATSFIASFALAAYSFAGAWVQDINGYRYQNDDGTFKQNEWVQDTDKRWFYLGDNGYMLCDQWVDNTYYVGSDGAMLVDTITPDFYKVGKDGRYIAEDQPIESMELTISRNGNDVSVIVEPGGGYSLDTFSILPNDRIELYLVAQQGRYFGISVASQIKLNGAKYERATRTDKLKHLRLTVALQDSEQIAADRAKRDKESEEWVNQHKAQLDLIIAYINASDDENAVRAIRDLLKDIPVRRFKYDTGNNYGIYAWSLKDSNSVAPRFYYGSFVDSKTEGVLCDREGFGTEYRIFDTNPSSKYDYVVFRGEWHNDAPNGSGGEYRHDKMGIDNLKISGNYVDWYEDGEMTRHYTAKGLTFTYNVVNRMPVSVGANGIVASDVSGGEKYYLHLNDTVQTALLEYTGYQKGNSSSVRTN